MHFFKGTPVLVLSIGATLWFAIMAIALIFMNPPECPNGYTQQQIDETGCIVGANIGLGLMGFLATGIFIVSLIAALVVAFMQRGNRKK